MCGATEAEMASLWPGLSPCFKEVIGDANRLINPRLEKERRKQVDYREKMSDAGKGRAKSKWDKEKKKNGRAMTRPMARPSKTDGKAIPLQSSSSSSSSDGSPAKGTKGKPRKLAPNQALGEAYRARWQDRYSD